ncbi:hypothetical protein BU16DRAFT_535920 [Lophium mytilinum]|uniref:Uncharacterized protein n=1 Tax=Lophium mytilinum TaxID=390894 RepID=A0A6A6R532_9PEZI|nr:hypothetical protein BU16DRAFT_535920 [Lophium mytilinum]
MARLSSKTRPRPVAAVPTSPATTRPSFSAPPSGPPSLKALTLLADPRPCEPVTARGRRASRNPGQRVLPSHRPGARLAARRGTKGSRAVGGWIGLKCGLLTSSNHRMRDEPTGGPYVRCSPCRRRPRAMSSLPVWARITVGNSPCCCPLLHALVCPGCFDSASRKPSPRAGHSLTGPGNREMLYNSAGLPAAGNDGETYRGANQAAARTVWRWRCWWQADVVAGVVLEGTPLVERLHRSQGLQSNPAPPPQRSKSFAVIGSTGPYPSDSFQHYRAPPVLTRTRMMQRPPIIAPCTPAEAFGTGLTNRPVCGQRAWAACVGTGRPWPRARSRRFRRRQPALQRLLAPKAAHSNRGTGSCTVPVPDTPDSGRVQGARRELSLKHHGPGRNWRWWDGVGWREKRV